MKYCENILETIGSTPLVKLNKVTKGLKPTILAKVEVFNPGGSIKDRPSLLMIEEAEKAGLLKPGGTIIEPTSGNTGTGLAQIAAVKGYKCILICPDKVAPEKINLLKAYGAEVVMVPSTVGAGSPESYYSVANRLTMEIPGSFQPNQFANPNNPLSHYQSTGPEIWEQTGGKITCLVAGAGTGGTISGTAKYLKEKNPNIKIVGADPEGSIYSGDTPGSYKVEGIGEDFIPRNADIKIVDVFERVSDKESFQMARRLAREEGLLVGGSCGTATVAALRVAQTMTEDDVIVVILPDGGRGYLSKVYSDDWLRDNGFLPADGQSYYAKDLLERKKVDGRVPPMITVKPDDMVQDAIDMMEKYGIDQLPVITEAGKNVGHINDLVAMQIVFERKHPESTSISSVMGRPYPQVDIASEIDSVYKQFKLGTSMVILTKEGKANGVLTKFDIVQHLRSSAGAEHVKSDKKEKATKVTA
ncbi:MAG: cystathionine beta-synthase [Candidatus Obscuribacter sp.]|nr:cystathionine beta-synthase [Candidatus Obscuribacter sp.]MDQ5966990.1 cystathionine beta-synthase [Cyanobacteriota bacterium erpe_2018_sw_39hr_WHONDRS-SW48-000098_B_bin.30]MBK7840436.1 cystathionine beta-synthase [Candidatus Obscuribacter sp.]MBK9201630.1 cystathionine beta-synthase [Candidatus Obscuribacter sp.]MBK9619931.1 cystathionine beta-synthase [Candidatus Obscuribacter sp.]